MLLKRGKNILQIVGCVLFLVVSYETRNQYLIINKNLRGCPEGFFSTENFAFLVQLVRSKCPVHLDLRSELYEHLPPHASS
jgi:hypothetical protein